MADGKLKEIESIHQLQSGCIVREKTAGQAPFSDSVVVQIVEYRPSNFQVKLSRPYAFVSGVGTTSPTVLLGQETITVGLYDLQRHYLEVQTERDCHHDFST